MLRFLGGVVSALLLVTAGIFIWRSQAEADDGIPPAPAPAALVSPLKPGMEAPSAPDASREERRFARYDANEDGAITRAEMMNTRRKAFAGLDSNGDGRLSFEEWAVATSDKFVKADADRSGALNAAEFRATKRETKPKPKCSC